jgi:hypothetical protein
LWEHVEEFDSEESVTQKPNAHREGLRGLG